MRLRAALCSALLVGFTVGSPASPAEEETPRKDAKDELKLLEGAWKVVGVEADGKKAPPEALEGLSWSFRGAELSCNDLGNKLEDKATAKLDPSRSPKRIDIVGLTGTGKGKTVAGIYKIDNGQLIVCIRDTEQPKKGRPEKFATTNDSGLCVITFERIKK